MQIADYRYILRAAAVRSAKTGALECLTYFLAAISDRYQLIVVSMADVNFRFNINSVVHNFTLH